MYGIIAGQGDLPCQIIDHFLKSDVPFVCLGLNESENLDLLNYKMVYKQFPLGQIGSYLDFFKNHNVTKIIFAGSVKRPNIFNLNLDDVGKKFLKQIGFNVIRGDDGLLSSVIKLLENEGFEVVSAKDVLDSLTLNIGILTEKKPSEQDIQDVNIGIHILNQMSDLDIGQAVVIERGLVLGVEAIEGTQELIKRISSLKRTKDAGVLVKMAKKNQSLKADLPTIGAQTIEDCFKSGLVGIAFDAKGTQVLNANDVIRLANSYGLFLKSF